MPIQDINERKDILRSIIPQLHLSTDNFGGKRRGGLNWKGFFDAHPLEAERLGYNEPNAGKGGTIWAANNVLARSLMDKEGIEPSKNGITPTPAFPAKGGLLEDPTERRNLLLRIFNDVPKEQGIIKWRKYFAEHPAESIALGYDQIRTQPKLWAANLRMTQQRVFQREAREWRYQVPVTPPVPAYTVETVEPDDAARQVAARLTKLEFDNKHLRDQLKECEQRIELLKAEKTEAALIIFDLNVQLRRSASK